MNLTNKHGVPDWLVESVRYIQNQYDKGEKTDYSATSLSEPPMITGLKHQYADQLEQDVSDALASFLGTSVHDAIERALEDHDRYIVERRFYRTIHVPNSPTKKDFVISGQIDLYDLETRELIDHKVTSTAKLRIGDHEEWEAQASVNRWLMWGNGYDPQSYKIAAQIKDWRRAESKRDKDYPEFPFKEISLPFWEQSVIERWMRERITELEYAKQGIMRPCTASERWNRPGSYKLFRTGRKSAICVKSTREECEEYLASMKNTYGNEYIEYVPGEAVRCDGGFCPVAHFCSHKGPL